MGHSRRNGTCSSDYGGATAGEEGAALPLENCRTPQTVITWNKMTEKCSWVARKTVGCRRSVRVCRCVCTCVLLCVRISCLIVHFSDLSEVEGVSLGL